MASREKKNGGDFILESRHLVGLFLLLVVIFGVVFTLGYLLGRSQYDSSLRAAVAKPGDASSPPVGPPVKLSEKSEPHEKPGPNDKSQPNDKLAIDASQPPPEKSNWEFYHSADPKPAEAHLQSPPKAVTPVKPPAAGTKPATAAPRPVVPAKNSAPLNAPLIPKGAIMLQVAAVSTQGDALALAQALQQKKFPAFVITPGPDKYYRVQVGPYPDSQAATKARTGLEAEGFKSIIKR